MARGLRVGIVHLRIEKHTMGTILEMAQAIRSEGASGTEGARKPSPSNGVDLCDDKHSQELLHAESWRRRYAPVDDLVVLPLRG